MADLKPISQFATASSVEANTLLFVSTPNQNNGYDSEKVSAGELGEALVNDFEYTQDLSTVSKKVTGAINELHGSIGADAYDPDATYNTGDLCIKASTLYKCNDDNVTGAWNSAKWDATTIAAELNELNTGKQDTILKYRDQVTTGSTGFISVTMNNHYIVLSAWADQGDVIIHPFAKAGINPSGNTIWWFLVTDQFLAPRNNYTFYMNFTYIN